MRKLSILSSAIFSIIGLISCEDTNKKYTLSVEIDGSNLYSSIISCPKTGNYKAGMTLEIKTHIIMDADIYIYLNNSQVKQIDSEGFWIYSFEMPDENSILHITMDQFYGRDEYTFNIFPWFSYIKNENDIAKIKYENEIISPLIDVIYTEDQDDISLFYDLLQESLIRLKGNAQLKTGGKCQKITYYIEDFAFELSIFDNNVVYWNNFSRSAYFTFKNSQYSVPKIKNPSLECYKFSNQLRLMSDADVYYYQTESKDWIRQGTFTKVFAFEFIKYNDNLPNQYAYIDLGNNDRIYICSSSLFQYKGKAYEIIGDQNFSLLCD